jgi:hypothetical protein
MLTNLLATIMTKQNINAANIMSHNRKEVGFMPSKKPPFCPAHHKKPYPTCVRPQTCKLCKQENVDGNVK